MTTNTLVTHKKMKTLGIGCISKELKNHYMVNWGKDDCTKCLKNTLSPVDVSKCKTVSFNDFRGRILMSNSETKNLNDVILGNEILHFTGIGWHHIGVVTENDLKKYPRVIH